MELRRVRGAPSLLTSTESALIGKSFATAALAGNHRARSAHVRTARSNVYVRSRVTCCFFPADTSCGYSPLAGSVSSRVLGDTSC